MTRYTVQELEEVSPMNDEIGLKPLTELQLTKDSSVQGVPLSSEAYEKAVKEGE